MERRQGRKPDLQPARRVEFLRHQWLLLRPVRGQEEPHHGRSDGSRFTRDAGRVIRQADRADRGFVREPGSRASRPPRRQQSGQLLQQPDLFQQHALRRRPDRNRRPLLSPYAFTLHRTGKKSESAQRRTCLGHMANLLSQGGTGHQQRREFDAPAQSAEDDRVRAGQRRDGTVQHLSQPLLPERILQRLSEKAAQHGRPAGDVQRGPGDRQSVFQSLLQPRARRDRALVQGRARQRAGRTLPRDCGPAPVQARTTRRKPFG